MKIQRFIRTDCFQFPRRRIIVNSNHKTKHYTRTTVSKLGYGKATSKKELFNAINDRFLLTYLLIRLIDYIQLFESINRFLK